jgi:type VI protein secretion system component Hcp
MRKLRLFLPVALVLCALPSWAANSINMTVSGLNCSVAGSQSPTAISLDSWTWGNQDDPTTGAPDLSQLSVVKTFDICSPDMLNFYLSETKLGTVTLTQTRAGSSAILSEVVLTNAWFASYTVGGSATSPASETWTLSFDKVCVTINGLNSDGTIKQGSQVCYPGS